MYSLCVHHNYKCTCHVQYIYIYTSTQMPVSVRICIIKITCSYRNNKQWTRDSLEVIFQRRIWGLFGWHDCGRMPLWRGTRFDPGAWCQFHHGWPWAFLVLLLQADGAWRPHMCSTARNAFTLGRWHLETLDWSEGQFTAENLIFHRKNHGFL